MSGQEIFPKIRKYPYSLFDQKRLVLKSQLPGDNAARVCRDFKIAKSTFANYKAKIDLSLDYPKDQYTFHGGRKSIGEHIEPVLDKFIEEMEDGMAECNVESLSLLANRFDNEFMDADFQRLKIWIWRFIKRSGYAIWRKTHVAQKPCDIPTCLDFVMHVNELIYDFNIDANFVINMDETPCYNDNRPTTKVVSKGAMNVNGARTRTGDYRTTIILACAAGGFKLKPIIVYKAVPGKTVEKNLCARNGFPFVNENGREVNAAEYCCQKKAWVDERTMIQWIEKVILIINKVLKPYISTNPGISLLMIDDYTSHKTKAVKKAIRGLRCLLCVLPPGSTSQVQVLDVGINKPFKGHLQNQWVRYMNDDNTDNADNISRSMLAVWVCKSWDKIEVDTVKRTFSKIGFY